MNGESRIIEGHRGIGKEVSGVALVAKDNFSARYDLDLKNGVFCRPQHMLYGHSYVGKILVLDLSKGGVATAWMLQEMVSRNKAPLALVLNAANPIMAQGAAFANLPLIDRFETDITQEIDTGSHVFIQPQLGRITVYST